MAFLSPSPVRQRAQRSFRRIVSSPCAAADPNRPAVFVVHTSAFFFFPLSVPLQLAWRVRPEVGPNLTPVHPFIHPPVCFLYLPARAWCQAAAQKFSGGIGSKLYGMLVQMWWVGAQRVGLVPHTHLNHFIFNASTLKRMSPPPESAAQCRGGGESRGSGRKAAATEGRRGDLRLQQILQLHQSCRGLLRPLFNRYTLETARTRGLGLGHTGCSGPDSVEKKKKAFSF